MIGNGRFRIDGCSEYENGETDALTRRKRLGGSSGALLFDYIGNGGVWNPSTDESLFSNLSSSICMISIRYDPEIVAPNLLYTVANWLLRDLPETDELNTKVYSARIRSNGAEVS